MNWTRFKRKYSTFQIIIIGFAAIILIGTGLLMLPFSSRSGEVASLDCALFTATSAVCVTGLIVRDTASYWSGFGQAVILILIQIGGLGVITIAAFIETLAGKKLSVRERGLVVDSISAFHTGGMAAMTRFIIRLSLIVEAAGAVLLMPVFCRDYGLEGVWMAVFHSISAFCNAGFDLMGTHSGAFSSLTAYKGSFPVVLVICLLIILGGIGFWTWHDIITCRRHVRRYKMQSKVILVTTLFFIAVPAVLFFLFEFVDGPLPERISLSVFQSVTPRTAGFNTADLSKMSGRGVGLMIALMMVGGAPGSTAGGMKITTVAVLFASAVSVFQRKKDTQLFHRRVEDSVIRRASALLLIYLVLVFVSACAISFMEGISMRECLFETASAAGTAGITLGITPSLGFFSHLILIALMFFGRTGGLTLMYAAISDRKAEVFRRPVETINVG